MFAGEKKSIRYIDEFFFYESALELLAESRICMT
jgi:hypothetical protein